MALGIDIFLNKIFSAEEATKPIGQPTNLPVEDIPAPTTPASNVDSIGSLMNNIGNIFDRGWSIYEQVTGRVTADEQIQKETIIDRTTQVVVQGAEGFYDFYKENKTAMFVIGGGFIFLVFALLAKKIGIIKR